MRVERTDKLTIPKIRARLYALSLKHGIPELSYLADQTKRVIVKPRARTESKPITREISDQVFVWYQGHPTMSIQKIAEHFGINPGRVSEIIHGLR